MVIVAFASPFPSKIGVPSLVVSPDLMTDLLSPVSSYTFGKSGTAGAFDVVLGF